MKKQKINILYMTGFASLRRGGQRSLMFLLKTLDRERFNPTLILPEDGELRVAAEGLGIKCFTLVLPKLRSLNLFFIKRTCADLRHIIRQCSIDIIHTDSVRETVYARITAGSLHIPIILHARVSDANILVDFILKSCADKIIAVSEGVARRFKGFEKKGKLVVIYNGVDLDEVKPVVRPNEQELKIGCFGQIEQRKGIDILIKAFLRLPSLALKLFIVGEGQKAYIDELKDLAADDPRIIFEPYRPDPFPLMGLMDVVALPSRRGEGLSRTIIEAMALGRPVIVSNSTGNPEAVGKDFKEFIFSNGDDQELSALLKRIFFDRQFIKDAAGKARRRAEEAFDLRKNTKAIMEVYDSLYVDRIGAERTILIINLGGLGDILLSLPALRALRQRYANSEISLLVTARNYDFAQSLAIADRVYKFYLGYGGTIPGGKVIRDINTVRALRQKKFALAVNMRTLTSTKSAQKIKLLMAMIKPKVKAGRDTNGRGRFLDIKIPETDPGQEYARDYDISTAVALGAVVTDKKIELKINEEARRTLADKLAQESIAPADILIGIHPGGLPSHRWPRERFAQVIAELIKQINCKFVLTGSRAEFQLAEELTLIDKSKVVNLSGKLDILELEALIERCRIYLTNDTGPMHLAAVLATPLVAIFGPGEIIGFDPRNISDQAVVLNQQIDCAPCNKKECPSLKCLKAIAVPDVVAAVMGFWRKMDSR